MKTEQNKRLKRSLFSIKNYFVFFGLISFVVTCCFLLFFTVLNVQFEDVKTSAIITFMNVLFLSLVCTLIDGFRRKMTVERPVRRILEATQQLTQGDFSARIKPLHISNSLNEFDLIIEDFNKMAQELSGVETLRSDFIASVSHELKTPLSVISNYATMLQQEDLTKEKRTEYAKSISGASHRLSDLIVNILKLNKLENQQIFPEKQLFNLGEQLRECLLGFEDIWEQKSLKIQTEIEDISIETDAEMLSLVWDNLLSNAIKFTEPGGTITVNLRQENDRIVVEVSDTGCGMSPQTGQHIFEKFYQGDSSHAVQGNGLGLALVKRIVDIIGGEISVMSEHGCGSTFTVKLRSDGDRMD